MSQDVLQMMLDMEREKVSRLETMSKRLETIITALQTDNGKLQAQLRSLGENAPSSPQEKDETIALLRAQVNKLDAQLQRERGQAGDSRKESSPELVAAQRDIIRLTKQLRSCELSLQEALDEKETLAVRLKASHRAVIENVMSGMHTPGVKPSDTPTSDVTNGSARATGGPSVRRETRSPDSRASASRTLSPTFRSRSPRFKTDRPQGPSQHTYVGAEDGKSISAKAVRRTSGQGTFAQAERPVTFTVRRESPKKT